MLPPPLKPQTSRRIPKMWGISKNLGAHNRKEIRKKIRNWKRNPENPVKASKCLFKIGQENKQKNKKKTRATSWKRIESEKESQETPQGRSSASGEAPDWRRPLEVGGAETG